MSIFPFIDNAEAGIAPADTESLGLLKEYAYDFEKNELLTDADGHTYMVTGNAALRIWILKALFTERYHYTAYSADFGAEWQDQLIGKSINPEIIKLELERYIIETLMINPYIKRLDNFRFEPTPMGVTVIFECTSVYGTEQIPVPIREVRL